MGLKLCHVVKIDQDQLIVSTGREWNSRETQHQQSEEWPGQARYGKKQIGGQKEFSSISKPRKASPERHAQEYIKILGKGAFGVVELWRQKFSEEQFLGCNGKEMTQKPQQFLQTLLCPLYLGAGGGTENTKTCEKKR